MKILTKIKRESVLIGVLFTMLLIGIVYAADYYQVNSGAQVTIDMHGVCKKVTNNNALAIFVPTKTADEWTAFRNNASGVTYAECCNVNGTTCSVDGDCCSANCVYGICCATTCGTCYSCNSSGSCVAVVAGTAGYGCTATHYRCDGAGNCTAPTTLTCMYDARCGTYNARCAYYGAQSCYKGYGSSRVCSGSASTCGTYTCTNNSSMECYFYIYD